MTPVISGTSPLCGQSPYSVSNVPQDATITWSSSNLNGLTVSPTNTISVTATHVNNYNGSIPLKVVLNGDCGPGPEIKFDVWIGNPVFNSLAVDGNSGPYPMCSSGTNITYTANLDHTLQANVSGSPSSPTFTLNSNSGLVSGSMLNSTTYDFISKSTSPNFTITASSGNSCGTTSQCLYFSNSGPCQLPQITSITINGSPWNSVSCSDGYFNYTANTWYTIQVNNTSGNPITYSANASGVTTQSVSSNSFKVKCSNSTSSFSVFISANNTCMSASACIWFSNSGPPDYSKIHHGKSLAVHPNPASTTLTIQLTDSISGDLVSGPYQVYLINKFAQSVYSAQASDAILQIPVGNLPADIYYLNVYYGDAVLREQIVISR